MLKTLKEGTFKKKKKSRSPSVLMVKPTLYQLIGHVGLLQQIDTNVRTIISPDISKYAISDVLTLKFGCWEYHYF